MPTRSRFAAALCALFLSITAAVPARAAQGPATPAWTDVAADPALVRAVEAARDEAVARFKDAGLTPERLAITVVDITDRARPRRAAWQGAEPIYPASVVKLFYLAAAEHALEQGTLRETPELRRALRDMIVDSSNDATHHIVDVLSGVTAGPALERAEFAAWGERRSAVNRLFTSFGYTGVNAVQKTWCEGPYGRENDWVGEKRERRNMLTTDAVARLLYETATGRFVSPERSRAMLALLRREPFRHAGQIDEQSVAFSGRALPAGAELFSKAGWTSTVRHDAAYVRLPNGAEAVFTIFTRGVSNETEIVPFVARRLVAYMLGRGARADVVYTNGRIWTGDPARPWASAMAVGGQTLLAVGEAADVEPLAGATTRRVDLGGRFVVPGFVDAHAHVLMGGAELLGVRLGDAASPRDMAARIGAFAKSLPKGSWVVGGGWDHERWPGAPLPTRHEIDAEAPDTPVFVYRLDGHMAVANSLALRLAGITRDTPNPPGGEIVKDPKTGEPTGLLKDAAMTPVYAVIPTETPAQLDGALAAAMRYAAENGVTSVHDIGTWEHRDTFLRAKRGGTLTVRVYLRTPLADWERQAKVVAEEGPGDEWVRLGGLKGFMDGSLGSTTAAFFEPYADAPSTTGLLSDEMADPAVMLARIRGADAAGLQLSVHAIGDRANALLLDMFERVARDNGPRDRRFRIEHAQHLRAAEIGRMARGGVVGSMQPYHAIDDGRWAEKRIGPKRLAGTYAFRTLLDMGAPLAFGSDWPVAPPSPLWGIYAAATRRTLDDRNPDGWVPEQKIAVEEALRAYTQGGAYAAFEEGYKGRLAPGYLADFVVLSENVLEIEPVRIKDVRVLKTVVGGREVYPR